MRGPFRAESRTLRRLLVLSGLDGSGKSTQAELLAGRLKEEGYSVGTVWNRWEPIVSAPLVRLARLRLKSAENVTPEGYSGFTRAKQRKMKSPWKRRLWQLMVWSEYSFEVNTRLFPHILRRRGVICDRYVYDTMIDMAINFSLPADSLAELFHHPLLSFYPKPALVVFLDVDPFTGASRKEDGTPAEYLADRREYYLSMARLLGAPAVDACGSIDDVSSRIWELTGEWRAGLRPAASRADGEGSG